MYCSFDSNGCTLIHAPFAESNGGQQDAERKEIGTREKAAAGSVIIAHMQASHLYSVNTVDSVYVYLYHYFGIIGWTKELQKAAPKI